MNLFLPVVSVKANKFHHDSLPPSFNVSTISLSHLSLASKHFSSLQVFLFLEIEILPSLRAGAKRSEFRREVFNMSPA